MDPTVEYQIDLADRHAHLIAVEARLPAGAEVLDLKLPAWTPGSYLIREFARHVQDLVCDDGEGHPLPVRKLDKATWRVETGGAAQVRARYRVYAFELTVRTAHLDDSHAFWNGACVYLYAESSRHSPARVRVRAPAGWRITTGLDPDPADPTAFRAADHDELVDSPFEVGTHELLEFTVDDRPHRIALWGRAELPREQLAADVSRIIEAAKAVFGDPLPYPHYSFILHLSPNGYGGLEHARSSVLLSSPFSFHPRKKYEELLELFSHEFFHLWNVKRIHPQALGPFDYQQEAHTRALWVMEGVTSYYDRHLLVRAGLQPPARYLDKLGEELAKIEGLPGRHHHSLEESSFDAWVKLYRPDEHTPNSSISYYLKGSVVALLCDLEIRAATEGKRTLDDVMRLLWRRHGITGEGFAETAVQALFEEAAGVPLGAFFDRHVRGRKELDTERLLATVGLRLQLPEPAPEEDGPGAWLGVTTRTEGKSVVVATALEGGPAVQAGLYAGDELIALDGFRLEAAQLQERLAGRRPGDRVSLTVFRRHQLRQLELTLGERPCEKYQLLPVDSPTEAQRRAYQAWLGAPLPSP